MQQLVTDFTATGSPRVLASAIEAYTTGQGSLNAIVVPWESTETILSIAVTSAKGDGWAIEHTNLGTIRLTDMGNGTTHVAIEAQQPDHIDKQKLAAVFDSFARQVQSKFQAAS